MVVSLISIGPLSILLVEFISGGACLSPFSVEFVDGLSGGVPIFLLLWVLSLFSVSFCTFGGVGLSLLPEESPDFFSGGSVISLFSVLSLLVVSPLSFFISGGPLFSISGGVFISLDISGVFTLLFAFLFA